MPNSKQRREAERRRLQRRIERERAALARRRQRMQIVAAIAGVVAVVAVIVVALVVTGGGSDSDNTASGTTTCTYTSVGNAARQVIPPSGDAVPNTGTDTAQITMNVGVLNATLDRANAPCAVNSFISLANQDYFNDTYCHRITTSGLYVLQCGDPLATGTGDPADGTHGPGYTFKDELTGQEQYTRGVLAMANSGPNTNGSQFFIVYGDSTGLSASYTIFGSIDDASLSVVDSIAAGGVQGGSTDGPPAITTMIQTVTIGSEVAKSASVASTASEASASAASAASASAAGSG